MNEKCEACSAREQEHGYGVVCEHNTPQEKEPWEKVFEEGWARNNPEHPRIAKREAVRQFIQSLLDAERAELVKEVESLKVPISQNIKTLSTIGKSSWQTKKYALKAEGHNQALDTVIEKIKNK